MRPIDQAITAHRAGNLPQAESLYRSILHSDERNFDALHMLGIICAQRQQFEEATRLFRSALSIDPRVAPCHHNYGNALARLRRYEEAVESYDKALSLAPNYAQVYSDRGNALLQLDKLEQALASFDLGLGLNPNFPLAHYNRGIVLFKLRKYEDALNSYDRAIALNPNYAEAHCNRGATLDRLGRYAESVISCDRALALAPNLVLAHCTRASALGRLKRYDEALASSERALALDPGLGQAHASRATALMELNRHREAIAAYDAARAIDPGIEYAEGNRMLAKMQICDWSNLDTEVPRLLSAIRSGEVASIPFALLHLPALPSDHLICASAFNSSNHAFAPVKPLWRGEVYAHDKIRLGYISADFVEHPVSILMAGMFEHHDRARFETVAIALGADRPSSIRERLRRAIDQFVIVDGKTDQEIAHMLRAMEIDIAIDLMGHTRDGRLNLFSHRPAPVQAAYLGYAGTTGADFIDYIIGDPIVTPFEHQIHYSEKIVQLPNSYLIQDATRPISSVSPSRASAGLPEQGFVFCSFNNASKLNPDIFGVWMRLLRAVEGSVLWLSHNVAAIDHLRREANARGVDAERLVFAPRLPQQEDHLARHRLADLFVDTVPYNAHATASDALWAGLPVLTCRGSTFAGRVAASLLSALGLPELITESLEEYESVALKFARDPTALASVKQKLMRHRDTYPLFDTERSTRALETAYTIMRERHRRGETPTQFSVGTS